MELIFKWHEAHFSIYIYFAMLMNNRHAGSRNALRWNGTGTTFLAECKTYVGESTRSSAPGKPIGGGCDAEVVGGFGECVLLPGRAAVVARVVMQGRGRTARESCERALRFLRRSFSCGAASGEFSRPRTAVQITPAAVTAARPPPSQNPRQRPLAALHCLAVTSSAAPSSRPAVCERACVRRRA